MNQFGVLTTRRECEKHEEWTYATIKEAGEYKLKLQFRYWYSCKYTTGLVCNFLDEVGNRVRLYCFRHRVNGEDIYNPKECSIDFEKVKDGTIWLCKVEPNKKNKMEWKSALQVG